MYTTFPVRYHGSQKDHHGTYLAEWKDCGPGCRADVPGWVLYFLPGPVRPGDRQPCALPRP